MKKDNNFRIEITYNNGVLTTEHCNNSNCINAYFDKIQSENKHVKIAIYDNKNRCLRFWNNLQD